MRNWHAYFGSLVWIALAVMLPVAALEPVATGPAAALERHAAAPCGPAAACASRKS